MALRIRKNGDVLCAALHRAEYGDTYIPDNISEILTGCTGEKAVLITDPEPIHSTHGRWWWAGSKELMTSNVEDIESHIAKVCECGSVHFNLLKSGEIECSDCQIRFGKWGESYRPVKGD